MKKLIALLVLIVLGTGALIVLSSSRRAELAPESQGTLLVENQGGDLEGHTPRGFAGAGTGLFVGDNVNPSFPEGDGVQLFLSFDLSGITSEEFESARLATENVHVRGAPFEDLGPLVLETIEYERFGPELWGRETTGRVCILADDLENSFSCDVSGALRDALEAGRALLQFRLRLEQAGDSDGTGDLVAFFKTDSNTNEPGIFTLAVEFPKSAENDQPLQETLTVPLVLHPLRATGVLDSARDDENVRALMGEVARIWEAARIAFAFDVEPLALTDPQKEAFFVGDLRALQRVIPDDGRLHIVFASSIGGANGIAFAPTLALVADRTSVNDFRATAHEIGHLLGLGHTDVSQSRLMFQGVNGESLSESEVARARGRARQLFGDTP